MSRDIQQRHVVGKSISNVISPCLQRCFLGEDKGARAEQHLLVQKANRTRRPRVRENQCELYNPDRARRLCFHPEDMRLKRLPGG